MTKDFLEFMREKIATGLERKNTQEALEGWERKALLTLKDGKQYHFLVANNTILVNEGPVDSPDMRVEASEETIRKLFLEEMGATTAILKRKLKVKGSASDLMKLKHIF